MSEGTVRAPGDQAFPLSVYFGAATDAAAQQALGEVLLNRAEPLIRQVVHSKLGWRPSSARADLDDICSEAVVAVISSLQRLRESGTLDSIHNFDAFVVAIARRACSDHSRLKYPEFHRLRNRLRYVLQNVPDFALWQHNEGDWLCGLSRWRPTPGKPTLAPVSGEISGLVKQLRCADKNRVEGLLSTIFRAAGAPLYFDLLVRTSAEVLGVVDHPERVDVAELGLPDRQPLADARMERNQWLASLWHEIVELAPNQRTALLLNLKDENGSCATTVFLAAGVASMAQIAAVLDIPVEEFVSMWREMPLADTQIAARLGISRQQVINLRKSARERLARRLK